MAVGHRIPIRGSVRSLSPTEGKFRVKGTGAAGRLRRYFWTGMRLKCNEGGHFPLLRYVPAGLKLFSLGRMIVITDNAPHKSSVFPAESHVQTGGCKGRRPTMTQFDGELSPPFEIVEPADVAGADHLQLAAFRLGLSARIP